MLLVFFFFNDTATTEIYTLSLHDALPICYTCRRRPRRTPTAPTFAPTSIADRKSTRLNSSHTVISYAVFCLKKKKTMNRRMRDGDANRRTWNGARAILSHRDSRTEHNRDA